MRKVLIGFIFLVFVNGLFAEPADNFKKAGIALGGYIRISGDIQNFLNDDKENQDSSTSIDINPNFDFFVFDNFSIRFSPSIDYRKDVNYFNYYEDKVIKEESSSIALGIRTGITYYITEFGNFVPTVGLSGGITNSSSLDGKSDGEIVENKSSYYYWNMGLNFEGLYFLNDSFALSASLNTSVFGFYNLTDRDGDKYQYSDDYNHYEYFDLYTSIYVGFRYFIPNSSKLIIK